MTDLCLTFIDIIASHQPPRRAARWDYQVIILQGNSQGKNVCMFYSMKNAEETPCTWINPVELENGDKYTDTTKWYLPATPGDSACASCLDGMVCDGLNFAKGTSTPLQLHNTLISCMYPLFHVLSLPSLTDRLFSGLYKVCVYECMYACMHVRMHVRMYVLYVCACMYVLYVCVCAHVYMCVRVYVCV